MVLDRSPGTLSRAHLLALGRQGGVAVWRFVPLAEAALRSFPGDDEMRIVLISNYGRLGLRSAALEHLDQLGASGASGGGGVASGGGGSAELRQAVTALDGDLMPVEACVDRVRVGVEVLRARGIDLRGRLEAWERARGAQQWFLSKNGNVVRRSGPGEWLRFADDMGAAMAHLPMLAAPKTSEKAAPVYLEGIDPPWLVLRLLAERPVQADGYKPRIVVVAEDGEELLDAMACRDLGAVLAEERLELVVGPGAMEELERRLGARMAVQLGTTCLQLPGAGVTEASTRARRPAEGAGSLRETVKRALGVQAAQGATAIERAASLYAPRDRAWWAKRYREALEPGAVRPLRVLISTSRFSTYIQHASADIGAAFRAAGCEARVLIEPDDSSTLIGFSYAQAVCEFEPDLVLMINYTRRALAGVLPEQVPHVCWVQDAMGHLFRSEVGSSMKELDFLVGHLHMSFFDHFGYPMDRALGLPVLASAAKFHDGPVEPSLAARFDCELACVTNHSQTPEQFVDSLVAEAAAQAGARSNAVTLIRALQESMRGVCQDLMLETLASRVCRATTEALRATGHEASPEVVTRTSVQIAWPLLDRMLRHQTMGWAAELAEKCGWRFHIYGRGWEKHPTLGRFSRGEVAHGEELRACYRGARLQLHVSPHTYVHQRVMECALSGGLPVCRLTLDHLCQLGAYAASCLSQIGAPTVSREDSPLPLASAADHWTGMALCAQLQRLGVDVESGGGFHIGEHRMPRGMVPITELASRSPWRHNAGRPAPASIVWLMGDLAETCFRSRDELEVLTKRAVERPAWREDLVRGISARVRAELTYEAAARGIARFVREKLEAARA